MSTIKSVVARKVGKSYSYTAIMQDGTEEVVRAKATRLYANAFLYDFNICTGKPAGLSSAMEFGKKPSKASKVVATFKIIEQDAPAKTPKKAAAKKPATPKAPAKKTAKKAPAAPASASTYKSLAKNTGKSKVEHPTKLMWDLCDSMQDKRRKDVIEKAVEMGISYFTARTQYQLWLTAFRNS